jgi:L-fuconolactonase
MITIDAHQHFWNYDAKRHSWINDDMSEIKNDFLPHHLGIVLQENNVSGCVAVQAEQTEEETSFLLQLASQADFIKGVVGWVDLLDNEIEERLHYYKQFKLLKGFRHILQTEIPEFMLQPEFLYGISKLQQYNFTYDILIFPHQLKSALQLVKQFPEQKFVIDHLAKPYIKTKEIKQWEHDIKLSSEHHNVFCKISGMVTEADWKNWTAPDLKPYLDVIVNVFGVNRIMFGSDWPVCLVASSYQKWIETLKEYFYTFTEEEQSKIFGLNAQQFYHLN